MKKLWHKPTEAPQKDLEEYKAILIEYVYGEYMPSKPRHMAFVSYTEDYERVLDEREYINAISYEEIKEGQGGFYYTKFTAGWEDTYVFDENIIRWCYRKDLEEME